MLKELRNWVFWLLGAFFVSVLSRELNSAYLSNFLENDLLTISLALFAINAATAGVMLTRLKELEEKTGKSFSDTAKAFKNASIEQLIYILLIFFICILYRAKGIKDLLEQGCEILLTSLFLASVYIVIDTTKAMFKLFQS